MPSRGLYGSIRQEGKTIELALFILTRHLRLTTAARNGTQNYDLFGEAEK